MPTVIGVFNTVDQAEHARESLLDAGFDDNAVRVQSQSMMQGDDDASTTSPPSPRDNDEGFMASVAHFFRDLFGGEDEHAGHYSEAVRRGNSVVVVTVPDEIRVEAACVALAAAGGAVDIDKRTESWRQEGYAGFDPSARPFGAEEVQAERSRFQAQTGRTGADNGKLLPVVQEEIDIGKRQVDLSAVRVFPRTEARNTVVDVEKASTDSSPDYRSHYDSNFASLGGRYEDYEPAYRYGSTLRSDARYASRSWDEAQADAQREWTGRYPDSSWERFKQAVRHGWESMTGQR